MVSLQIKNGQIKGLRKFVCEETSKFLEGNPEERFTAREIASHLLNTHAEIEGFMVETSDVVTNKEQTITRLVARLNQFKNGMSNVKTTESRPRKFYFTNKTDNAEVEAAEKSFSVGQVSIKEHDLYPMLSEFLWSELEVYSKRIDEKRSRNSRGAGGNKWLYPDLVGMEDLSGDWHREIKDCVQQYADKKTKLWSFEVKILINRSNVREVFFQAVSNSSWANFGYLVASEIEGSDTLKELRMLSSLHGIGFIRLDAENPSESQIMIPAKERIDIDWNTANRLTEENRDFLDYIKLVRQFYQTGDVRSADWDAIDSD